jgi:hypothetical protein
LKALEVLYVDPDKPSLKSHKENSNSHRLKATKFSLTFKCPIPTRYRVFKVNLFSQKLEGLRKVQIKLLIGRQNWVDLIMPDWNTKGIEMAA